MDKKQILIIVKTVGAVIVSILSFLFLLSILKLDVLTNQYIILIMVILDLLILGGIILLFQKKKILIGIGIFLLVLTTIVTGVGLHYTETTNHFLDTAFGNQDLTYTNTFYLVALANHDKDLDKIKDSNVGYYVDTPNIDKALDTFSYQVNKVSFTDIQGLFQNLGEKIDYFLIEKNIYESTFEFNQELKRDDYQIITTFDISMQEESSKVNVSDHAVNIYIGGTDFTNQLYDFNMIVTLNLETHDILLTSIPRDYHILVAGTNKADNIGYHGALGITTSKKSLENLLGISIDYYVKINTESLVGVVDTLGGINFCSDTNFTTTHATIINSYDDSLGEKLNVQEGCHSYTGIETLTIARERLAFSTGDRQRQKNCQQIMINLFNKAVSGNTLLNYQTVLNSIRTLYTTDMPRNVVTDLVKDQLEHQTKWSFTTQSLNGYDSRGQVHLGAGIDYIMLPNQNSVDEASTKIKEMMNR